MAKKNSIESAAISFNSEDDGSFSCELRSNLGRVVHVARHGDVQSPEVEGDAELTGSPAIVDALWLAAVGQKESDDVEAQLPSVVAAVQEDFNFNNEFISPDDQRDFAAKAVKRAVKRQEGEVQELREQAIASAKLATTLAELMDTLSGETEEGWCSRCLTKSTHRKSKSKSVYVCESCGSATSHCTVPQCDNFAAAGLGLVALSAVCAEHLHQVPDFERLEHRIDDLTQWSELREFKAANVGRAAKFAAVGAGALVLGVAGGWVAAPMVGSAYGTTVLGLSGAAAHNAGLAALGFGSLASGGLRSQVCCCWRRRSSARSCRWMGCRTDGRQRIWNHGTWVIWGCCPQCWPSSARLRLLGIRRVGHGRRKHGRRSCWWTARLRLRN